jgi:hypothetical protein
VDPELVMVFNQSAQKPLFIRPPACQDHRVGPSAAATSLPYPTFAVVFAGRDDEPVSVHIDAWGSGSPVSRRFPIRRKDKPAGRTI